MIMMPPWWMICMALCQHGGTNLVACCCTDVFSENNLKGYILFHVTLFTCTQISYLFNPFLTSNHSPHHLAHKGKKGKCSYSVVFIVLQNKSLTISVLVRQKKSVKRTTRLCFLCRWSWALWWCNRKAATSQPAANIWSGAWSDWGNTPGGPDTWIPGSTGEDCPLEGGVVMGHRHWQVCVRGRLHHRQISSALLWPETCCLPLPPARLRAGKSHRQTLTEKNSKITTEI